MKKTQKIQRNDDSDNRTRQKILLCDGFAGRSTDSHRVRYEQNENKKKKIEN